jgi:hypothetical protein
MQVRSKVAVIDSLDDAGNPVKIVIVRSYDLTRSLSGKTKETGLTTEMLLEDGSLVVQVDHGVYKTLNGSTLRCDHLCLN